MIYEVDRETQTYHLSCRLTQFVFCHCKPTHYLQPLPTNSRSDKFKYKENPRYRVTIERFQIKKSNVRQMSSYY